MRRALTAIGVALLAVLVSGAAQGSGLLDRAESDSVDLRFRARGEQPTGGLVVVGIDDVTFSELGRRWPFPRHLHARAIDALREAGARRIVYDVQFTEPSGDDERSLQQDLALFEAVARAPGTVLATSEVGPGGSTNVLGGDANLAEIGARAAASHLPKDGRGVVRRVTASVDGLDTIAVATASSVIGRRPDVPTGSKGALIDFRGPPGTIPSIPFSRVIGPAWRPPAFLRGAIVVIGATSPSLQDMHATPVSSNPMAGPEVQANAIWTALHGVPLRPAHGALGVLAMCTLALMAPLASLRLRFAFVATSAGVAAISYAAGAFLAFRAGVVIDLVAPLCALAVATLGVGVVGYLTETRERRRVAFLNAILDEKVRERTAQLRATQLEVVRRLSQASESRDNETGMHIERMSRIAEALALASGMGAADAEELRHAAVLHDIGKLGVPDYVLLKEGRLTDEEREIMKTHTTEGAGILTGSESPLLQLGEAIALTHHERWDGRGYPAGLSGEEIPLPGRICAIADVFDALVSTRRYKTGWPLEKALAEFRAESGRQFDPGLVDVFLTIAPRLHAELGYGRREVTREVASPA